MGHIQDRWYKKVLDSDTKKASRVTSYCSWLENRKVSGRACIPGGAQRSRVGVWAGG